MEKQAERMNVTDEDYFIDLKLGNERDIQNMFKANTDNTISKAEKSNDKEVK